MTFRNCYIWYQPCSWQKEKRKKKKEKKEKRKKEKSQSRHVTSWIRVNQKKKIPTIFGLMETIHESHILTTHRPFSSQIFHLLAIHQSVRLSVHQSVHPSICLSLCPSVHPSIHLSDCCIIIKYLRGSTYGPFSIITNGCGCHNSLAVIGNWVQTQ